MHILRLINTRRSQWRTNLPFCTTYLLVSVPAEDQSIIRFLIHLALYCKYSTVINYLFAINVLHRHFGFDVTFQEVFPIKLILCGLRRILGDARVQELPMTPDILLQLHPLFTARSDTDFRINPISCPNQRRTLILPRICVATTSLTDRGVGYLRQKRFSFESFSCSFPLCSSQRVALSAPCKHMKVTF